MANMLSAIAGVFSLKLTTFRPIFEQRQLKLMAVENLDKQEGFRT
jgi:hypothetical protein